MLRLVVAALLAFAVFAGTAVLAQHVDEPFFVIVGGVLLAFVGVPAAVLHFWRPLDAAESARRAGNLQVMEFDVTRAWRIAEREDEGLHFVLELASGGTLFLSGQFLQEPFDARVFPCARVTLSVHARSREVLAVACNGPRIDVAPMLAAFSDEELDDGLYPGSCRVYAEPPHGVLAALGRAVRP